MNFRLISALMLKDLGGSGKNQAALFGLPPPLLARRYRLVSSVGIQPINVLAYDPDNLVASHTLYA